MAQGTAIGSMVEFPLMARIINAVHSTVFYLEKFFIPLSLSPHYSYFQIEGSESVFKALLVFSIFFKYYGGCYFCVTQAKSSLVDSMGILPGYLIACPGVDPGGYSGRG